MDVPPLTDLERAELSIRVLRNLLGLQCVLTGCLGVFIGDWVTQMGRELALLRHLKAATLAPGMYFATRICAFSALACGCLAIVTGDHSDRFAEGIIASFIVLEALSLSFVHAILAMRSLVLWHGYTKIRIIAIVCLIISSGVHFVKLYAWRGQASSLGLWAVEPQQARGGRVVVLPYFMSLCYGTGMTVLTIMGARRQSGKQHTAQELLRMQPGRGTSKRREFIASRILRGQLLHYLITVTSSGVTAFLLSFNVLKGYNAFIPLPINLVLTCSSACNIVLSMRSPIKSLHEIDHGLSLLPQPSTTFTRGHIETRKSACYELDACSSASPKSTEKECGSHGGASNTLDNSSDLGKNANSYSPVTATFGMHPNLDTFSWKFHPKSPAPFGQMVRPLPARRNSVHDLGHSTGALPTRAYGSMDIERQQLHFEQQSRRTPGLDGVRIERNVVMRIEQP